MEFIGEYLKNVRLNKKIRLASISSELKISLNILQDIEKDCFPKHIDRVFLIGHLSSYAKFLNLNSNEVIERFKIQTSYYDQDPVRKISKPIERSYLFSIPKSISYFSVLIFATSFYFLFINANNFKSEYAMTPDVPENLLSKLEGVEMQISLSNKKNDKNLVAEISLEQDIIENQSNITMNSSSVVASLPSENSIKELNKNINLKFLNSTWIQLRDEENEIIFSRLMNQGDEYSYQTNNNYALTAGNAGNIIISLDGLVLGKAGKAGEVLDSLIIKKNFNQ